MFKRLFFALVGLGAGVTVGVWAVRKLETTQAKLTPSHLGGAAASRAGALRERLGSALAEGRAAAAQREAELRHRITEERAARMAEDEPEPQPAGGTSRGADTDR